MNYDALSRLCKASKVPIPKDIEKLPEFWSINKAASLGGKRRFELYGAPGTIESRRKGGINSSKKFMLNAELTREKALFVRKKIRYPRRSSLFAEFIGILHGDGGVIRYQVKVSFNSLDKAYAEFVVIAIKKLFFILP